MKLQLIGKNDASLGSECVVFGQVEAETGRFVGVSPDILEPGGRTPAPRGSWRLRQMSPGPGLTHVPALVTASSDAATSCETSGRLIVLSHGWSGVVRLSNREYCYQVDLHYGKTRLLLLDVAIELAVDVTALALSEDGALHLPALTMRRVVEHIVENRAWLAFLDPRPLAAPGLLVRLRDALARRTPPPGRVGLISLLLPALVSRGLGPQASVQPAPADESRALRDELRLVTAALDGLSQRVAAGL